MDSRRELTTADVLAAFADEVTARQGRVTDTFDDGRRLLARSVLPHAADVRPGDRVQGGVAVRATGGDVRVHPYLFRLVCRNGAIIAQALQTRHLAGLDVRDPDEALRSVREAVGACCEPDAFTGTIDRVRTACEIEADLALNLMPMLSRLSAVGGPRLLSEIMDRFLRDGDQSRFGLANAVTATARDTRDPELKWDLEEFGGGVAAGALPPRPPKGLSAVARRGRAVPVG
jgi:hypothetical protein